MPSAADNNPQQRQENDSPVPANAQTPPQHSTFPIVGIGASAGGLNAFEAFFTGMPADTDPGMAFVLVQHLAPDHNSLLADLIRRYTCMQVAEVEDGMTVVNNRTYIIPPGQDMAFANGRLQLLDPVLPHGQRLPIDFLFRSLADDQGERAIGIVLTGTGSDGSAGVRAIKGAGGMIMVQDPDTAAYDGMPRSAIATGLVDYVLAPQAMAAQLIAYSQQSFKRPPQAAQSNDLDALNKLFILLRAHTGHDFSQYKPTSIRRRLERRMAIQQIATANQYIQFAQQSPAELSALFRDLLIGVTGFFRDPEAFHALAEQVMPQLFIGKPANSLIRVWVPGCATGEESYSIAMLLAEQQAQLAKPFQFQIFATDIDSEAIAMARAGQYPAGIASAVSPARLARFFVAGPDAEAGQPATYTISKPLRDLVVFSEQDIIRDPPFSHLDLISCRNLLIYFNGDLQKTLANLFHYALNPGAYLFLGTSESVSEHPTLFRPVDRKAKLYQRREAIPSHQYRVLEQFPSPPPAGEQPAPKPAGPAPASTPREATEQGLLVEFDAIGILVDRQGDVVYIHALNQRPGWYLEPAHGEIQHSNLLRMARPGLQEPLAAKLHQAVKTGQRQEVANIMVQDNGGTKPVDLVVNPHTGTPPTPTASSALYLVILKPAANPPDTHLPPAAVQDATAPTPDPEGRIAALENALRAKDEYLQSTTEELQTANEELKSSNEEMQSINEELQSTNEELETSKEELQSVNEELITVNTELENKIAELSRANNDMNNLLAGSRIATVFVDHGLNILRFTPTATNIIHLIPSDVGRSIGHIVTKLVDYPNLLGDIQQVLDTLAPCRRQVATVDGKRFLMHIQPYRTQDNVIEGAVLTFVEHPDSPTPDSRENDNAT